MTVVLVSALVWRSTDEASRAKRRFRQGVVQLELVGKAVAPRGPQSRIASSGSIQVSVLVLVS